MIVNTTCQLEPNTAGQHDQIDRPRAVVCERPDLARQPVVARMREIGSQL